MLLLLAHHVCKCIQPTTRHLTRRRLLRLLLLVVVVGVLQLLLLLLLLLLRLRLRRLRPPLLHPRQRVGGLRWRRCGALGEISDRRAGGCTGLLLVPPATKEGIARHNRGGQSTANVAEA